MDILKRKNLKRLPAVIGPVILVYIFVRYIDMKEVLGIFGNASLSFVALSLFFNILLMLLKVHRIYFFMKRSSAPIGFFTLAETYAQANFLGQISNVVVSDVVNAGALMLRNGKKTRISNIFIFNRTSDLFSIVFLFSVFFALNYNRLSGYLDINYRPFQILLPAMILLFSLFLFLKKRMLLVVRDLREMVRGTMVRMFLYAFFIYLFYCLSAICDGNALRLDSPPSYILLAYMMGSLVTVLPISVAGIGTRDILFIFLLELVRVSPEKAVALSSLGFLFIPYLSLLVIYLLSLVGVRIENRRHHRP